MDLLSEQDLPAFLSRFASFDDGVIRKVEHRYGQHGVQRTSVIISVMDQQAQKGWSNVTLVMDGVSEFVLREGRTTCVVLSFGVCFRWIDGKIWCLLSPYSFESEFIDDFRRSDFYVVASSIAFSVSKYSEEVP